MVSNNIKILVAYHKKAPLIKSEIFIPIHVGKEIAFDKSKDGIISNQEMNWLEKECIGDNTGDNISKFNRFFCEMTAIYWAWKNYDKLGNPDYIGLVHYRTLFQFMKNKKNNNIVTDEELSKKILEIFYQYDIIAPSVQNVIEQSGSNDNLKNFNLDLERYPLVQRMNDKLKQDNLFYYKNMFILPRKLFFEYYSFVFDILFSKFNTEQKHNPREIGYLAEFLTSFYLMDKKESKLKVFEEPLLTHAPKTIWQKIKRCFVKIKSKNNQVKYYFLGIKIYTHEKRK